eukprot:scpid79785/ scgid21490/ Microfibrillar-associated protein 1
MSDLLKKPAVHSTAGAVPVQNDKGEVRMEKVKVSRYIAGKRPLYAAEQSSSSEEDDEELQRAEPIVRGKVAAAPVGDSDSEDAGRLVADELGEEDDEDEVSETEMARRVELLRARVQQRASQADGDEDSDEDEDIPIERHDTRTVVSSGESDDEDMDDEAMEKRRELLRQRARERNAEEEVLQVEEEKFDEDEEEEESSEYEEYTDSEDETGPRLKPVFVRKTDRLTIAEKENMEKERQEAATEAKKLSDARKRDSRKLVELTLQDELNEEQKDMDSGININTDDEDEEAEFEAWKVRELKRIKRDRDDREKTDKERAEAEKVRNMSEEERRAYFRANPKQVTNKALKGKVKYLQKYYHRGAFYLNEEENVLTQDFHQPTLEDHFDKTVLPKVMQVKNFGRTGRTKYTHLVDQDTTSFDSPWANAAYQKKMASTSQMSQSFEKPSAKRKKV